LTTMSYSGNQTTVTDPAGKVRTMITDGLGRLSSVTEDPGASPHLAYLTTYAYDVLNNLTSVTQGTQTRTFVYDNLGRLIRESNPENTGTITSCYGVSVTDSHCYTYDLVGNLTHRTDARNVLTTYTYDALNRISGKTYSDGTPSVTYTYDNLTNSKGRLTKIANANSTTNYSAFDPLGRVTGSNQVIGGITYPFSYVYNRASAVTSETYPTGRVITTNYDGANRPSSLSGTLSGSNTTYVSPISYFPHGAISSATLGNSVPQNEYFNSRLEPTQIVAGGVLTLGYGYGTTNNNGNPLSQTIARPGVSTSLSYGYDGVNRLVSASQTGTTAWSQTYGFDNFGNRWLSGNVGLPGPTAEVPQTSSWYGTNNRISTWSYDSAGNILSVSGMTRTFTYDAENLQKTAAVNGTTTTYLYDGNGQRVKKTVGAGTPTVYVYDAMGSLAVEYGLPFDVGTRYLTADSLGSTRLVTKGDGTVDKTYDYLPFGEQIGASYPSAPSGPSQKFTGQERDAESGLDNFQARYMSGPQGRFQSPDSPFVGQDPGNPQSWNLFAYVLNDPLTYTDPSGNVTTQPKSPYNNCFYNPWLCSSAPIVGTPGPEPQPVPTRPPPPASQQTQGAKTRTTWDRIKCANEYANNHSLAAMIGLQDTFLGKALGGNIIGGLGEISVAVGAPGSDTNPISLGAGIAVGGASLGLPVGGPGMKGATGLVQDAVVKATVQEMNTLVATSATQLSAETLETAASGVGLVKLGADIGIYAYGAFFKCQ
jgi:RHS repeat-associated protein